jgi:hypothetical protein
MKYRKKPVVIEAIQWTGENTVDIDTFTNSNFVEVTRGGIKMLEIYTLEGTMKAHINDYIIKGVQGEFYPCKPKIFEETYEVAE